MSQESLIWRPNRIPLAEWENVSREEQIQWWKDRQEPYGKPHMKRTIKLYEKGAITLHEFPLFVCRNATEEDIPAFLEVCPAELLNALKDRLMQLPADDDDSGWPQVKWIGSACYAPWVTGEEIQESNRQRDQDFRNGVRLLRKYFPGRHSA
jgi:hypothetical protein